MCGPSAFFIDKEMEADNGLPADVKAEAARKAEERLKYMTFYSTTQSCLRGFMLKYFGEAVPGSAALLQLPLCRGECAGDGTAGRRREAGGRGQPRRLTAAARPTWTSARPKSFWLPSTPCASGSPQAEGPGLSRVQRCHPPGDSQKKPFSTDEFLNITGVGEKKAARYGTVFLAAIEGFRDLDIPKVVNRQLQK